MTDYKAESFVAFSSEKKWSGISFGKDGTYVMGAEEFIFGGKNESIQKLTYNI